MNTITKPNLQGIRAYEFQLFSTKQTWFKEMCCQGLIHHKKKYILLGICHVTRTRFSNLLFYLFFKAHSCHFILILLT